MKKRILINLLILIILLIICYGYSHLVRPTHHAPIILEKRDTLELIDTQYVTKTKTIVKPTLVRDTLIVQDKDTISQKQYSDTVCLDKDTIMAQSYISGRNAKLDSLSLQLKKAELTKERTITIEKNVYQQQPRRFKDRLFIAPSVGVGYGVINKQADIYIGVSAGIKLF